MRSIENIFSLETVRPQKVAKFSLAQFCYAFPVAPQPPFRFLLPATAMMLGWGLRGFIGGGPFGAMIPGAMVMLSLAVLYPRRDVSLAAAYSALAVGFGGEMTYGQTVGFIVKAETFWWGFLGLGLKGAIWALLAVPWIVLGLYARASLVAVGSAAVLLGTEIGWRFINQPKLIYFSNRFDRPREEVWAGFLLGALALYWVLWRAGLGEPTRKLMGIACLGGFVGFGVGGAIQGVGVIFTPNLKLHWWKYMEFFFGFCFGWALAYLPLADFPEPEKTKEPRMPLQLLGAALATAYLFWGAEKIPLRYAFLLAACPLLYLVIRQAWLAKYVAFSITFTAFAFDSARHWSVEYQRGAAEPAYTIAILCSGGFAWLCYRYGTEAPRMLELLTWAAVADALFKLGMHPSGLQSLVDHLAAAFVLMAIAVSWMLRKVLQAQRRTVATS